MVAFFISWQNFSVLLIFSFLLLTYTKLEVILIILIIKVFYMKIFDMHIHTHGKKCEKDNLLAKMNEIGVFGGCVISTNPIEYSEIDGLDFDKRVQKIIEWKEDDRLFPVVWIHPFEKDIVEKVKGIKNSGIVALKIICNNFSVSDDKPFDVIKKISKQTDFPIIFHSGILWDGQNSSKYNRPVEFERLIELDNLRFALAHCSWPWIDECISLYGKFAYCTRHNHAEMFFDLTAGTPEIYRRELLTKLFTIGYDVPDNILFGTDCDGENYSTKWARKWLDIDNKIYDELSVANSFKQKIYQDNLMRFLGFTKLDKKFAPMTCDGENRWSMTENKY